MIDQHRKSKAPAKRLSRAKPSSRISRAARNALQLGIVYRKIADLKLDPRNPRIHNRRQRRQIARSIRQFGFVVPILIRADGEVIAGHGRIEGAVEEGMTEVPTICLDHLSEVEARALKIADNRLTEISEWDDRLLAEQLKELSELELEFDLELTGFTMGEIDIRIEGLGGLSPPADDPADSVPPISGIPIARQGDRWLLGRHCVVCDDARIDAAYERLMRGEQASMVFADPPYNLKIPGHVSGLGAIKHKDFAMASGEMTKSEFTFFLTTICRLMASHSSEGAIHFICMDWRHFHELLAAGQIAYRELKNICVWVKDNAGMGSLYRSQHEFIAVWKHGKGSHPNNVQLGQFGRHRTNVWHYPGINTLRRQSEEGNLLALHPTVKPVAMIADAMMDCSARGDLVLDPFLGSGSTLIAAERTGRRCFGLEIDPLYVDTVVRRWQAYTGEVARHELSGRSFADIEAELEADHD